METWNIRPPQRTPSEAGLQMVGAVADLKARGNVALKAGTQGLVCVLADAQAMCKSYNVQPYLGNLRGVWDATAIKCHAGHAKLALDLYSAAMRACQRDATGAFRREQMALLLSNRAAVHHSLGKHLEVRCVATLRVFICIQRSF